MPASSETKASRYYGLVATITFHAGLLLLLMWTYLTTPTPPMGSGEPVLVNIGIDASGSGDEQPMDEITAPEPVKEKVVAAPEVIDEIPPVTSDNEETIKVEETKPKKEKKVKKEKVKEAVQDPIKEEVPKPEPEKKVNPTAIYKGNKNKSKSEGDDPAGTPGDKGVPDGGLNSAVYKGASGNGTGEGDGGEGGSGSGRGKGSGKGVKSNVIGRKLVKSPVIGEKSDETGKVVVSIVVDKTGKVIKATAGARGSTINSSSLYRSAEDAAMNAKFDAPDDAPDEQRGTITFNFQLK